MVLLPQSDVLSGDALSSASTEMASEGTPVKVSAPVAPPTPLAGHTGEPALTTASASPLAIDTTRAANGTDDVTGGAGPLSPYRPSRVKLSSVYKCITCNLCKGYLIDATTIVECLHSFCHSCIMKHLRTEQYCPQCEMMINKAKPNIKPDATLQAIVYKLVPKLYENELHRRRLFYRKHPEKAATATPEQRGEDTEYLIFSPNEKISLSLEYAEKELAEDNEELLKPKYLLCPAIFSIALLKKFIIYKYGISERQFCVEIMYKVKTIILPDYYTLMDVAYIYTWKRDAPMKYYYRIRTTESNPVELPEVALRRSPNLVSILGKPRTSVDEEDDKENVHLERVVSEGSNESDNSSSSLAHRRPEDTAKVVGQDVCKPSVAEVPPVAESPATPTQPRKNESIKLKIELNKNKYVSILQSPQPDEPVSNNGHTPSGSSGDGGSKPHKSEKTKRNKRKDALAALQQMEEKSSELKIKIEKMKDTGLVGGSSKREGKSSKSGKHQQLAVVPYKVGPSPGISQGLLQEPDRDAKRLHSSKNGTGSSSSPAYCKLKIKTPKSGGSGSSSGSNSSSPEDSKQHHHPIVLKIDQRSPEMATATLKFGMPRKTDKSMTPSPPPLPPSPPAPSSPPQPKFADEKSQFLNSFQLAPIQAGQSPPKTPAASTTPPSAVESVVPSAKKSPPPSVATPASSVVPAATSTSSPPSSTTGTVQVKRKAKDSAGGAPRSGPKKPKLSDDEMKAIVEKTVAENIRSPSEHIVPPTFLKPKVPAATSSRQPSPPLPTPAPKPQEPSPKRDSPRPFAFKTPPPPPPPIVSANNIPAVKPSQQVLPAPIPQKPAPVPIRPALAPKPSPAPSKALPQVPQTPARKPTTPTKLPTSSVSSGHISVPKTSPPLSNGHGVASSSATTHAVPSGANKPPKGLELKRAQSNPSINIPPPVAAPIAAQAAVSRDTEISKLRPEDLKKNSKVYGPPTTVEQSKPSEAAGSFAVPSKIPPKTTPTAAGMSVVAPPAKSSGSGPAQGAKARPLNYLNYALLNSKAAAAGSRTPIPSYSSSSPSYSPDSPQYNPNLNFSSKQFKYANPLAYNSHLQNMLNDRKTGGSTSPPSVTPHTIPVSSPSPPQDRSSASASTNTGVASSNKRPASSLSPSAEDKKQQPPEKQPLLANPNPLDKFPAGIPDGLSVTLATDEDDAARIKNVNKQLKNNFIEIRALPEVPITEVKLPLPMPSTIANTDRHTPPAKVGAAGSPGTLPGTAGAAAASSGAASPQGARKSTSPNVVNPAYSVAASVPTKTTSTTSSSSSSTSTPSSNGKTESIQRKFFGLLDKQAAATPDDGKTAPAHKPTPPPLPPVSRPSTPKTSNFPLNNNTKFKLPNATVNENGTLKLNSYREVDMIPKAAGASSNGPKATGGAAGTAGSNAGTNARPMAPPNSSAPKSIVPIAPKPSQQPFTNGRMAMSPPIPRSPAAAGGAYIQPKSKTPPSHLPSMARMGPMFDIQMKSAAIGASGGTPSKKPPSTGATTLSSGTVPRRKIVPTSNSTSLVPLKTSPISSTPNGGGSKLPSNYADFITLHPQGPVSSSAPPPRPQDTFNQQQAALTHMLRENFARQYLNNAFPYLLQQFTQQQQHNAQNFNMHMDSVTITASPMAPSRNTVSQNSLTVTAIPPGPTGGASARGGGGVGGAGGGGVVGGHIRNIGGGGSNPGSRNSS